ncbi:protein kinase [Spirillospora sp. NPDC029432]|uniref:protein kinase domain-containing protein n=1 Tax=Spirillospora sp. NPDC029432 TaxID=3154599 RepID=UPI0034546ED0
MRPGLRLAERYRLAERLDAGSGEQVWRAWDEALGRPVAVKLPAAGRATTAERHRRFRERVVRAVRVDHPAFTTVYDCDLTRDADGRPTSYVVTAFLDVEDLAARAAREPLTVPEALECCAQIAEALAAAHAAGVAHGGLRPEKVFPTPDGVRIADLGLAGDGGPDAAGTDMRAFGALLAGCLPEGGDVPAEVADLASRCRSPDPARRPGAGAALEILRRAREAAEPAGTAPEPEPAPVPETGPETGPEPEPEPVPAAAPAAVPAEAAPTRVYGPPAGLAPAGAAAPQDSRLVFRVAVTAAVVAALLAVLTLLNRDATDGPHGAVPVPAAPTSPGGTVSTSPTPERGGRAEPVSVPAAYATLGRLQPIIDGARAAGEIRSDVAVDLNNLITNLRNDLAAGRTDGIAEELARIREKIDTRLRERALDGEVAARMTAVLSGGRG